jgi:DNA-binding MarR family transcriptional regulator
MATGTGHRLDDVAHELFQLVTQICLSTLRGRRRGGELKEVEFLTLSLLQTNNTMIVGEIQRLLGILPAQMSRVIRSLENRERALIQCRINPRDKRKIDVALTPAGLQAWQEHQDARLRHIGDLLARLPEEDLEDLHRLLEKVQEILRSPVH